MHQYTADMANRMARSGYDVHLVTTSTAPTDRYASAVHIHTPVQLETTGFSSEGLHVEALGKLEQAIRETAPDVVHFTGPHLWNTILVRNLTSSGLPVVHTLHDLDPHSGSRLGMMLRMWNWLILRSANHILVHGKRYYQRVLESGVPESHVSYTPLLHLFLGTESPEQIERLASDISYEPWALFFGRLEKYKGLRHLLTAAALMSSREETGPRLIIAGRGEISDFWAEPPPEHVEVRNYLIEDEEAIDLFRRCGCVVLPYIDATQSALIAAAYFFRKPVIVTRTGALPEYVIDEETGLVVEPDHPTMLARAMETLLSDPARLEQMGAAGRAWYDRQRAEELQALQKMYRQVMQQRRQSILLNAPASSS